jgi:hypothetical protein
MSQIDNKIGREIDQQCGGLIRFDSGRYPLHWDNRRNIFHPFDMEAVGDYVLYTTPDNKRLFFEDSGKLEVPSRHFFRRVDYDEMHRMRVDEIRNRWKGNQQSIAVHGWLDARDSEGYYPVYRYNKRWEHYSRFCEVKMGWIFGPWFAGKESFGPATNRLKSPKDYKVDGKPASQSFIQGFQVQVKEFRERRKKRDQKSDLGKGVHREISDLLYIETSQGENFKRVWKDLSDYYG